MVQAELELRVGEDHPALARVRGGERVQLDGRLPRALHQLPVPDELDGALEIDRLVVSHVRLRAGREERFRQLLGLAHTDRQRDAGHRAACPVVPPARTADVAAHHALHRQHAQAAHDQRPSQGMLGHANRGGEQVVGHDVAGPLKPEHRQTREHPALVRDRRRMHGVVGRDPVARDHQQPRLGRAACAVRRAAGALAGELVHLADLPPGDERQVGERGHVRRCYQRRRGAPAALGPPGNGQDGIEPPHDLLGEAGVVLVVEDGIHVEIREAHALVLGQQLAQRRPLLCRALG